MKKFITYAMLIATVVAMKNCEAANVLKVQNGFLMRVQGGNQLGGQVYYSANRPTDIMSFPEADLTAATALAAIANDDLTTLRSIVENDPSILTKSISLYGSESYYTGKLLKYASGVLLTPFSFYQDIFDYLASKTILPAIANNDVTSFTSFIDADNLATLATKPITLSASGYSYTGTILSYALGQAPSPYNKVQQAIVDYLNSQGIK